MKFLFLVGSSIKHFQENHFSAHSEETRFEQTLQTIKNIREKVPNSYIVLFECSFSRLDQKYIDILVEKCDLFLEFYDELGIKNLYENIQKRPELITYGKSLLETRGLLNSLYEIGKNNYFSDAQRIFKVTGRYLLNDDFNICDYESKFFDNKYIIKKYDYLPQESENYDENELENVYAYLYGAKGMMVTGLWSFDRLLFSQTIDSLQKAFFYMERMIQYTAGTDIEHSLYRFIDKNKIVSINNLGLTVIKGMKGENGGVFNI
jgi:hypothetical protein